MSYIIQVWEKVIKKEEKQLCQKKFGFMSERSKVGLIYFFYNN